MSIQSISTAITGSTAISGNTAITAISGTTAISGLTAITAIAGIAPVAGSYDGATASGLLTARDGIVGQWLGQTLDPPERDIGKPKNLAEWSLAVRDAVILQDLLSKVGFASSNGTAHAAMYHYGGYLDDPAAGTATLKARRMLSFVRPPKDVFAKQLPLVRSYADLRGDRAAEILTQVGYPTSYFAAITGMQPGQKRHTHELIGIVQAFASSAVLQIKHALACQRPDAFSAQVQPMVPTPGHPALPSGHATENFAAAIVLGALLKERAKDGTLETMLLRQAARIAINRTVAGVHFPVDSVAGAMMGITIGRYLVGRAIESTVPPAHFDGTKCPGEDFDYRRILISGEGRDPRVTFADADQIAVEQSDVFGWLWDQAVGEWEA